MPHPPWLTWGFPLLCSFGLCCPQSFSLQGQILQTLESCLHGETSLVSYAALSSRLRAQTTLSLALELFEILSAFPLR